jgi:hypothetical protein
LRFNAASFRSVKSILTLGLDRQTDSVGSRQTNLPFHENIRGGEYYH